VRQASDPTEVMQITRHVTEARRGGRVIAPPDTLAIPLDSGLQGRIMRHARCPSARADGHRRPHQNRSAVARARASADSEARRGASCPCASPSDGASARRRSVRRPYIRACVTVAAIAFVFFRARGLKGWRTPPTTELGCPPVLRRELRWLRSDTQKSACGYLQNVRSRLRISLVERLLDHIERFVDDSGEADRRRLRGPLLLRDPRVRRSLWPACSDRHDADARVGPTVTPVCVRYGGCVGTRRTKPCWHVEGFAVPGR
jgi:hypothetical protein